MNLKHIYPIVFLLVIIFVSLFISSAFGSNVSINGVFQIEGADNMGNGHIPPTGSTLKDDLHTYLNDINLGNADLTEIEKKLNTQNLYPSIQGNLRTAILRQLSTINPNTPLSQIPNILGNVKLN
jgi:capsule polysaccharide export protein KpsE/RkpR